MATGDIIGVIDTLEFDTDDCSSLDIIHIAGNVYLIAYRGGVGPDGILKTVTIESDGSIGSVIATRIFEATWGFMPSLAHISGDVYIVGYRGPGNDGWLKTFTVDSSGNIGAVFNSKEIDLDYGRNFRFYHLGGTVWLVAYQDASDGWLKTLNINPNGTFGTDIDSQKYDTVLGAFPALIHIAGDIFAIAYTGTDEDGWLKTWEIQSNGTIAAARTDEFEFSTDYCLWPQILPISGDVYAIAYQGPPAGVDGYGYIKTLTISSAGAIGGPVRTFQYTHSQRARGVSAIIHIAEEVYTLVYTGSLDDGYLVTVTIHDNGQIDDPLVDELEFDPDNAVTCEMVKIADNTYAIGYSGVDDNGFLRTIEIEVLAAPVADPIVTTNPTSNIEPTPVTLNGTLDYDGGEACACGFEYGETTDYGSTTDTEGKTTGETFSQGVRGLKSGTVYHFRAIATNSGGTSYGADRTFHTEALSAAAHQALGKGYPLSRAEI